MKRVKQTIVKGIILMVALSVGMGNISTFAKVQTTHEVNDMTVSTSTLDERESAEVSAWKLSNLAGEELAKYDEAFRVQPSSAKNNGGKYGNSTLDKAWDDDRTSHWETGVANSASFQNYIDFHFATAQNIGSVVYGARADASNKGFATAFEIYSSNSDSGEDFQFVSKGQASTTSNLLEIKFPEHQFKRLRFVWVEAKGNWASARAFYFYKSDKMEEEIKGLFTDNACSSLRAGVTVSKLTQLQEQLHVYPLAGDLQPYLDMASKILSGSNADDDVHEPMKLAQRGNRNTERNRTATAMTLASFDLSGYYAIPGEVIEVFVDADASGPMPRLVMAAVCQNKTWVYGYDGKELVNGYNRIKIPDSMQSAQAIYFYNPALPDEQTFAPTVRLIGGTKYPVYRYDANDPVEVTKEKEAAFITELKAYEENITDDYNEAMQGKGNYNIAEYVSDKILISVSARGAINSLDNTMTWNKGDFKEWEDKARFGEMKYDLFHNLTGISYGGPAAVMECYEMLFDDIQVYSGFNNSDPTHPDYRNYGQFLFRAYSDGSGLGWGQSLYSGYNTGSQPNGSKWDKGFYEDLVTVNTILSAGWAIFHEIGHVFDSSLIGTSESTNNLYGLMAQLKYTGTNRMADPGEDRWYKHFTSYINSGVLPQNDLLFYPGAVIYQLDAIDFSKTTLYQDEAAGDTLISNYGRAGRYARLHRDQMSGMSYTDRLVISFSMACGVDLSTHFGYYGRTISDEAKRLLTGLPKETRPTWIVNDRTFQGGAFDEADKAKAPEISEISVSPTSGEVTINLKSGIFTEQNLQTFSIYRREVDASDQPLNEYEWIGVTGDQKTTQAINELYLFKDKNVKPGSRYQYRVKAFDCTLMEIAKADEAIVSIDENVTVPLSSLLINNGDEGKSMNVGNTYKVQAVFAPMNATVDLNSIRWSVEGYGRDSEKNGGGPDIITLLPDPDYPNDPTRRIVKGIQNGQTHIKVSLGGLVQTHRMVINGTIDLNSTTYDYAFHNDDITLMEGAKQKLNLQRTTKTMDETINVATTPSDALWRSKNTEVATVSNRGEVGAVAKGETDIEFVYKGAVLATCHIHVKANPVALTGLAISGTDTLAVGTRANLRYTMSPSDTTENKKAIWASSDDSIVAIDENGTISALRSGEATIRATIDAVTTTHKVTVPAYIPLKSVTMKPDATISLTSDRETVQLSLEKNPVDASASSITWESSAEAIATVDETGLVTGKNSGTAIITGYIDGKSAKCTISVSMETPLTGLQFRGKEVNQDIDITMKEEEAYQLMVFPVPLQANHLSVTKWRSDNEAIATVKEGYIVAHSEGNVNIYGRIIQNEGSANEVVKEVKCTLHVQSNARALKNIGINHPSIGLEVGAEVDLMLTNQPTNANRASDGVSAIGEDAWVSSDPSVVEVDAQGKLTAKHVGEATIRATRGGITVNSDVVVHSANIDAQAISLNKTSLYLKTTDTIGERLQSTLTPSNATVGVYWKSSNPAVAKVDQAGNVVPVGEGEAIITASANQQVATCHVNVSLDGSGPKPDNEKPSTPGNVATNTITQTEAVLTWEASMDNIGVVKYLVYVNNANIAEVDASTLTYELKGLSPAKDYKVSITAMDMAGNESEGGKTSFLTLPLDTAPLPPNHIQTGEISETLATITWEAPVDASDVYGYIIYRNGENVGEVDAATTRFVIEGLVPDTAYEVAVVAINIAKEESARIVLKIKTPSSSDSQKPEMPKNITIHGITQTDAMISWNAASDNVGVVGYQVYVNGKKVEEVTKDTLSTTLKGLIASTKYEVAISAIDQAKNESEKATATFTTQAIQPVIPEPKPEEPSVPEVPKPEEPIAPNVPNIPGNVGGTGSVGDIGGKKLPGNLSSNTILDKEKVQSRKQLDEVRADEVSTSSIPLNLQIKDITDISAMITWASPIDTSGILGYRIYQDGEKVGEVSIDTQNYLLEHLVAGTEYEIAVASYNQADEFVSDKVKFKANTSGEALAKPAAVQDVNVDEISQNSARVSWKAPTNSTNISGYCIYLDGTKVEEVDNDTTMTKLTSLASNTTYQVTVTAYDVNKQESSPTTLEFTTSGSNTWSLLLGGVLVVTLGAVMFGALRFFKKQKLK